MNNEIIEKFVETAKRRNQQVNVHFKTRSTLTGVFVTETLDYAEMKKKNFWRIVPESRMELWKKQRICHSAGFSVVQNSRVCRMKRLDR